MLKKCWTALYWVYSGTDANMFTFILFSWISKSVLGSCSLSNKELGYYGKVEDLHLSYSVDDIIEQYVKKMSLEKLVNMFEFCNCKKNDVSVFCMNIFKTYYSTYINSNREENLNKLNADKNDTFLNITLYLFRLLYYIVIVTIFLPAYTTVYNTCWDTSLYARCADYRDAQLYSTQFWEYSKQLWNKHWWEIIICTVGRLQYTL